MKAPPYFPFYQRDFVHSCRAVQMTPGEIGALVMVMCQQWEAMGPIGLDPERFAAYTGWDIRVARRLLARLVELDKVKRSEEGVQSSRMADEITKYIAKVRAAEAREERKRASAISRTSVGSLANFSKKSERCSDELFENANENKVPASSGAPLPDIRYQISDKNPPSPKGGDAITAAFAEFWSVFPGEPPPRGRKTDKPKALEAFRRIVTNTHRKRLRATVDEIIGGAKRYASTKPNPEFIPMPTTWLNGARWLDEAAAADAPGVLPWWKDPHALAGMTPERWRAGIAQFANGVWPADKLGPPPGHHQCVVPPALIDELRLTERYTPAGISRDRH